MARVRANNESGSTRKIRPALTPEAEESQMISLAVDLAKKRLIEGTASSQEIIHYLKLATPKHQLEIEKLEKENELLRAKTAALESTARIEELYMEAMKAMSEYRGTGGPADA